MLVSRAPKNCTVYAEGKTKLIWKPLRGKYIGQGLVHNKPFVTAGDGKYCEHIPRKDMYVTAAACNIFSLLNRHGIPTHFHKSIDEYMYLVRLLTMMPIEIVVRFIQYGSYLERNPYALEGVKFAQPLVEFYIKNDALHDPIMSWDPVHKHFHLYDPHKPLNDSHESLEGCGTHIGEINPTTDPRLPQNENERDRIINLAQTAGFVLSDAFGKIGGTLVDFKFEGGYDKDGKFYIGDQIDPDSCRIWMNGDKTKAVDKDRYRRFTKQGKILLESKERKLIAGDYKHFAEMTAVFNTI